MNKLIIKDIIADLKTRYPAIGEEQALKWLQEKVKDFKDSIKSFDDLDCI